MILFIESKKQKRTGFFPAFVTAGLLASAFPVLNMLVRAESFIALPGNAFTILLEANWGTMAMFNILLTVLGSCIMYHTEYADNGIQKLNVLPVNKANLFFGKFIIESIALFFVLILEHATLTGCALYWFNDFEPNVEYLLKALGFEWFILLPTVMLMLLIASACQNMWVSLGIGVILVFSLSIFPSDSGILSLFPFNSPYQLFSDVLARDKTAVYLGVCAAETSIFGIIKLIYANLRRLPS